MSEPILYEYDGEKHTMKEWAELYGVTVSALRRRYLRTGDFEFALNTGARRSKNKFERYGNK